MLALNRLRKMSLITILKKLAGFDEIYTVAYRRLAEGEQPLCSADSPRSFDRLPESKDYWYADPILFRQGHNTYLYMEAFEYQSQRGCIAYSELDEDKGITLPKVIIREPYHMSFPVIFQWQGATYMLPETNENHSINLYKSVRMPDQWEKFAEIATGEKQIVDMVLLEKTDDGIRIQGSVLNPNNPLQTTPIRGFLNLRTLCFVEEEAFNQLQTAGYVARNAGVLYEYQGKWFFPMQISTDTTYGLGVRVYECGKQSVAGEISTKKLLLDGIDFEKMVGVHSYCNDGKYEVVDLRYEKFRLLKWYYKLRKPGRKSSHDQETP